jgi:predicted nucleotidyltransferase
MKTTRKKRGKPDPTILADIVERVVRAANPQKIVLFGSAARGTMGSDSDYDLLVIKGGKFNRDRVTVAIYREMIGKGAAVDVVVVTPEEVERYRDAHCLVIRQALIEGRVVYVKLGSRPAKFLLKSIAGSIPSQQLVAAQPAPVFAQHIGEGRES